MGGDQAKSALHEKGGEIETSTLNVTRCVTMPQPTIGLGGGVGVTVTASAAVKMVNM